MRVLAIACVLLMAACEERSATVLVVEAGAITPPGDGGPFVPPVDGGGTAGMQGTGGTAGTGGTTPDAQTPADACSASLADDPANCGACGSVCSFPNALPLCAASVCARGDCLPGFVDLDNLPETGCEYQCTASNGGAEVCDGKDNNCNGLTDEGTDLNNDVNNCGGCGIACTFLNATASCSDKMCVRGACTAGFEDANGVAADGCECAKSNGGVEICDGFDNDCNGMVDDVPGIGASDDPRHCGACNANCLALSNATGTCVQGGCSVLACAFGFANADGKSENGCELACPGGFLGAAEVCDGIDNDCDGKVDAADDSLVAVINFCQQKGECAGAAPECKNGGWVCNYGSHVELTAPNQIVSNETRCDGKDNDCDGCIDETFPQVGLKPSAAGGSCTATPAIACADDKQGVCQGKGKFVCSAGGQGVTCLVDQPGAAPAAEQCNGKDDNCDGIVDNAGAEDAARVKDAMVAISGGPIMSTVYMDAFEASRPDADATKPGNSTARACSKPAALPWTNVTAAEAAAACAAAGKRLCSEQEWQRACETSAAQACTWSFATACTTSANNTCNVYERGVGAAMSTGASATCHANWGANAQIFDLTGNVREWTQARTAGVNPLRGGSYDTVLEGATCQFSFLAVGDDFRFGNSGFRCCSNTAP